jgi:hypothetical protein
MTMKNIPDIKYEIDGELLSLEQGQVEPSYLTLHKIHIQLFAKEMGINSDDDNASPKLISYLEDINEQAEALYRYLDSVPSFPPSDNVSDDVVMARALYEITNQALAFWGNN